MRNTLQCHAGVRVWLALANFDVWTNLETPSKYELKKKK